MRSIKACFLSCVWLLQGPTPRRGLLLLAALNAWHKASIPELACPLSTNVNLLEGRASVLAAGEVWKLSLWNSHIVGLLHFRCWMILAYSNLDLLGDN